MYAIMQPAQVDFEVWDGTEKARDKIIELAGDQSAYLEFSSKYGDDGIDLRIKKLGNSHYVDDNFIVIKSAYSLYSCDPTIFELTYVVEKEA